jgi:hypothetical protein
MAVERFRDGLKFGAEPAFRKPRLFASFPIQGRLPASERVVSRHFLGRIWQGPVLTVSYRCGEDTATGFRAYPQPGRWVSAWMREWEGAVDSARGPDEKRFQGLDEFRRPLIFWSFSEGIVGLEGCFDTILAGEYVEKMRKMSKLWVHP